MKSRSWNDDPQVLLANSHNGVIRVLHLENLGIPAQTAYRRCSPDGQWRRLLPGIVSLHNGQASRLQQVSAALLYGGPDALITGAEACRRYGLGTVGDDDFVHLLVPIERKLHNSEFVIVERTSRMPKTRRKESIPLAPVTRAALDAARRMRTLSPCRALLTECVQRRMTTPERLRDELARGSQRGSAIPRKAIAEMSTGAQSVAEIDAVHVWDRAELPPAAWNGRLFAPDGTYVATPDAWCDDVAFAWEIDSLDYHLDPTSYARTLARNARYAAAGVIVLQTLPSRLRNEPGAVVAELRSAYAAAAARPRPSVTHRPQC